jgi:hypothetical protein
MAAAALQFGTTLSRHHRREPACSAAVQYILARARTVHAYLVTYVRTLQCPLGLMSMHAERDLVAWVLVPQQTEHRLVYFRCTMCEFGARDRPDIVHN